MSVRECAVFLLTFEDGASCGDKITTAIHYPAKLACILQSMSSVIEDSHAGALIVYFIRPYEQEILKVLL